MWPFKKKQKNKPAQRGYQAALYDRLVADWVTSSASADAELRTSLTAMRNRSRDLARNDDYVKNILRLLQNNVVGEGMPFQCQIRNERGGELNARVNDQIETEFYRWSKADCCDVSGQLDFSDIQKMGIRSPAQDGGLFIRLIKQKFGKSKVPLALEMIEDDLCDENYNETLPNGNEIKMGVEQDKWGRPVAYHFFSKHPADHGPYTYSYENKRLRVPASEVIHLFVPERPKQTRAAPWLASAMLRIHHMKGLSEAEVIAARASASLMGFIESPDGELQGDGIDNGQRVTEFEPGVFKQLNPGEKVNVPQLNRPGNQFDPFMKVMLRGVAAGAGMSYESVSRDYSMVNYSSARQALLEDRDAYRVLQRWLISKLNQKVFEVWLEQAVLAGVVQLPKFFQDPQFYFDAIRWMPRGWNWIDPAKEVAAYKDAIRCGFITQSEVVAQGGGDFEEMILARSRELDLAKKHDLKFDSDPSSDADKNLTQNQGQNKPVIPEEEKTKFFLNSEISH